MQQIRKSLFVLLAFISFTASAQQSQAVLNYIYTYKELAMAEMKRTGVPAAITLAQGIHESGAGLSKLVQASNNHFGIKCKSNWTGESVRHDDDARAECFRKYPKSEDSYRDHSDFLKNGQRYAFLFEIDPEDYAGWAHGLKKAGYATNPKYPQVLIKTIEDYNLQEYTSMALGRIPDAFNKELVAEEMGTQKGEPVTMQVKETMVAIQPAAVSYPQGAFKINDTKVVFVKKGTSFFAIASQYAVDLSKLFDFNEMPRAEEAANDQLIYLQRKRKTGAAEFHVVQPGETLYDIAQLQAIRLESLRELNWLKENEKPVPGEKLSLQKKSTVMPKLAMKENYSLTPGKPQNQSTN